jgi:hypothetical protein
MAGMASLLSFLIIITWVLSAAKTWTQESLLLISAGAWAFAALRLGPLYDPCFLVRRWRESWLRLEGIEIWSAAVILVFTIGNLIRIYLLPPLNVDSYHIHLARAYYWLYEPYIGVIDNYYPVANVYPITVHLLLADWLKVTGSDHLVECISLLSYVGLFLVTRSILSRCGATRSAAAIGTLLVMSMPILVVCSITTQVDVPSLFFVALALYFCSCSLEGADPRDLVLSGLSSGLAIGSKPQGALLAGALALCVTVVLLVRRTSLLKASIVVLVAAVLAVPGYLFNWYHTGSLLPLHMHEAEFSLGRFFDNWSRVYPQILFRFPFAPAFRSRPEILSFFDHDESNYGPAFTILLLVALASWFRPVRGKRRVETQLLVAVLVVFMVFMSSTWQQQWYRWDVRLLSYGAYIAFLLVVLRLREELDRRGVRLLLWSYAVGALVVISLLDSRAGIRTVWEALRLPDGERSFARLSAVGFKPPAFFQSVMDDSHLPDGGVALIKAHYESDVLGILFGSGPKRPAYYFEGSDSSVSGMTALVGKCQEYIVRLRCRWLLVDYGLRRFNGYLNGRPTLYRAVLVDPAYGILYHVDIPEQLGRRDQVPFPELKDPKLTEFAPTTGTGLTATFSLAYAEGNAGGELTREYLMINDAFRYDHGCVIRYDPKEDAMWLFDDQGTMWLGPETPKRSSGRLRNGECTVNVGATAVDRIGSSVRITVQVVFQAAFSGNKQLFITAQDSLGTENAWQLKGSWAVRPVR